ncbi:MAG: phosphotransferase [Moraxellaceae bacterium]|nr:phosphotransferase [Moraxellaceae bacterium]
MEHCKQESRRQALYVWAVNYLTLHTNYQAQDFSIVSGDASFRRYFRLHHTGGSYIAVDAPPDKENSRPFVAIAQALYAHGVHVPQVISYDFELGFMLLSDLGDTLLRPCLTDDSVNDLYQQAMRELVTIQSCPSPVDYALPPYDSTRLMTEMALLKDWFIAQYLNITLSAQETQLLDNTCQHIADEVAKQPNVFVHRDYHSRNLMIIDANTLGVIDFQDAVTGAITYDLVSLLRDAYVEWPQARVVAWVEDFRQLLQQHGQIAQVDAAQFLQWFDYMGAQRHLKVVGIFARLSLRDGKHGYLNDIPLVFKYLLNELKDYAPLQPLYQWLCERIVPVYLIKNPTATAMLEAHSV